MSGMEVEDLRPVAPPFSGVVVAEILEAEPHPKADRLRVCGRRRPAQPGRPAADRLRRAQCACRHPVPLAMVGASCRRAKTGKPFRSAWASCAASKAAACCARRAN
jgi:phenylalanyl-tRNA synthetase beta chain